MLICERLRPLPEPAESLFKSEHAADFKTCPICLEDFVEGERIHWLPCTHGMLRQASIAFVLLSVTEQLQGITLCSMIVTAVTVSSNIRVHFFKCVYCVTWPTKPCELSLSQRTMRTASMNGLWCRVHSINSSNVRYVFFWAGLSPYKQRVQ
jgi:hypothetical protein